MFLKKFNHMHIISRSGSQLTVNFAQLLNILTPSSSSANITNLLVNLSYAPSSGNITLVSNINGVLNVQGYQVLGTYTSTGTVTMIGLNINSATVIVNKVSFKPTAFNVGNWSSYLFGKATTMSTILICYFAVIIGNNSNYLLLDSILTTKNRQVVKRIKRVNNQCECAQWYIGCIFQFYWWVDRLAAEQRIHYKFECKLGEYFRFKHYWWVHWRFCIQRVNYQLHCLAYERLGCESRWWMFWPFFHFERGKAQNSVHTRFGQFQRRTRHRFKYRNSEFYKFLFLEQFCQKRFND
ncbi:Hypothetical_protein [Hexamita inflata]|uniref:Hypothetical_protein n=1 Tax=Hexamita inflata TaxID=28002 RepID=A0AA86PZZ5_9EUKA|nr:Hypothetical protein HINF_LOCUS31567 [Hexamita inflata]